MDKKARNREGEAGSSDEEEAFESADEGEESGAIAAEKAVVATSADTQSYDSTSKEIVDTDQSSLIKDTIHPEEEADLNRSSNMDLDKGIEKEGKLSIETDDNSKLCSEESIVLAKSSEEKEKPDVSEVDSVEEATGKGLVTHLNEHIKTERVTGHDEDNGGSTKELPVRDEMDCKELPQISEDTDSEISKETSATGKDEENETSDQLQTPPTRHEKTDQEVTLLCDGKGQEDSKRSSENPGHETSSGSGGWDWGGWTSMLTQATASVTSGLSSVIETVEMSLGVPDPEEMARKVREEEKMVQENIEANKEPKTSEERKTQTADEGGSSFLPGFDMSSLTNIVQSTGKDLVSGGLEALEFIGKKTMDVLAEGDPGLRHKRERLTGKGPSLSQVLKEAKEASEQKAASTTDDQDSATPSVDLFSEFDRFQGVAHLEALEILSRDSEAKLESHIIDLTEEELAGLKPLLLAVEEVFHIDENEQEDDITEDADFISEVTDNVKSLNLLCVPDKIIFVRKNARAWIESCVNEQDETPGTRGGIEIYSTAVSSIAEIAARTIEFFHKFTELLLHQDSNTSSKTSSLVRAQSMRKLTDAVLEEISVLATHFAGCLNTAADDSDNPESVSSLITTVYLDSSTSASYLRNSLKLLRPVLQLTSLNEKQESKS